MSTFAALAVLTASLAAPAAPTPAPAAAEPPPLRELLSLPRLVHPKLSPGGTRLAAIDLAHQSIVFVDLATMKAQAIQPDRDAGVGDFSWVSEDRVVTRLIERAPDLAVPRWTGELWAVNADLKGGALIAGYRAGEMQTGSHLQRAQQIVGWARVVSALPDDPRHVLVAVEQADEVGDRLEWLYRLDVFSGARTDAGAGPARGATVIADERGAPRLAYQSEQGSYRFFVRADGAGWRPAEKAGGLSPDSKPIAFSSQRHAVYVVEPTADGFGLFAVDPGTGQRRLLSQHDAVPPSEVVLDPASGEPIAVEYEPDLPTYDFLQPDHPLLKAVAGLQEAHPEEHVRIESLDRAATRAVVRIFSDRHPGQYVLLDARALTATPIVTEHPGLRPEALGATRAFHIQASDGLWIHGYLTLPPGLPEGTRPPLVILPHGGPHFVRDDWGFDGEVQALATRGFAVLQVNFRGSGGYGPAYHTAGLRHWGDLMIQDLVDATRWAVKKGYADPRRVCAFGASYGAYAAMQLALRAPDLVRCAAGYAGIYDLGLMYSAGDIRLFGSGREFLQAAIGSDPAALSAASPARHADQLKVPVLLVHGKKDERAPLAHAEALRDALTGAGRPPLWLVEPHEGHGFFDLDARVRAHERILEFLKAHAAPPPG